ncbi:hypothetical protein QR98_0014170 [Sarcoptes scabiei]|uniref:Uncharacterized protein n=1 Tax=Sarcoptes scabiei TaxID=52283 RepID=A0A131ZY07_SARSC|nr:hypothetical protein QR98_0014170 [Sarcoptes scabiei]
MSNLQAHLSYYQPSSVQQRSSKSTTPSLMVSSSSSSLSTHTNPDYIDRLILLKQKLERDKLFRNNDKTTPPLPPYTINPHMNHYMSYTPNLQTNSNTSKSSKYSKNGSMRRSTRKRRSTRSLYSQKSKSNSMGALNIRSSSGSLKSISKQNHRKSATSLLMMNNNDTSFSNNTIGSRSNGRESNLNYPNQSLAENYYGTIISPPKSLMNAGTSRQTFNSQQPPPAYSNNSNPQSQRHSVHLMNGKSSAAQHAAKFLNSDSETDYYHTFTPAYLNNGLANPLYGKRNSYLDSSETAI